MNVVISSHVSYFKNTLPPLLASLSASGVPNDNISIIVGGSPSSSFNNNINFVTYNSFEYTGMRYVAEQKNYKSDYICLLHDTVTVDKSFWNNVKDVNQMMKMIPHDSLNIGVYPVELLRYNLSFIKTINTKESAIHNVDFIFGRKPLCKSFGNLKIKNGMMDIYNTGNERYIESYPDLGITKYRANISTTSIPITHL